MSSSSANNQFSMLGALQVIIAATCWGSLGIFSTYLNQQGLTGLQITTLRIMAAAVLVLVCLPWLLKSLLALTKKQWLNLSLQSLVGVLGMTVCFIIAVTKIGVAMAVALLYTAPVFSLFFAHVLLDEKMTKQSVGLALLAFIGVALSMSGDGFQVGWGVVIGLLSGVCYSFFGILGKKAVHEEHSPLLVFYTAVTVSAVALLLLPSTYTTLASFATMPMQSWWYVLGLSLLGTITPFALYMLALQKLPATSASVFTIFEPLVAILLSVVLLNQGLNAMQMLGIGLIILSALLNALFGMWQSKTA